MKTITLTKGYEALVSNRDYKRVVQRKWCAHRCAGRVYARTSIQHGKKFKQIMMHRWILGITDPKVKVDHKNHNGIHNFRHNLRIATNPQNAQNQRLRKDSASGFKGVWWSKHHKKWRAYIKVLGKSIMLGYSTNKREAAKMYDKAARRLFGRFAYTNFGRKK